MYIIVRWVMECLKLFPIFLGPMLHKIQQLPWSPFIWLNQAIFVPRVKNSITHLTLMCMTMGWNYFLGSVFIVISLQSHKFWKSKSKNLTSFDQSQDSWLTAELFYDWLNYEQFSVRYFLDLNVSIDFFFSNKL